MPYDDGRNSARARSARIRADHDYEANQLDAMRRRSAASEPGPRRGSLLTLLAAAFGRTPGRRADAGDIDVAVRAGHVD